MSSAIRKWVYSALLASAFACPAAAQNADELRQTFSGAWYVFDDRFSVAAGPCRVSLENTSISGDGASPLRASVANCADPLAQAMAWRVESGKILLTTEAGEPVAALGGNPRRLSGDYAGAPNAMVLERESGSGAKAALSEAIGNHGCYYRGYTPDCVAASETNPPSFKEGTAKIEVLVKLNVRNQPRRGAPTIGTVPGDTEISVNACLTTSDGIWCRARFDDTMGWMAKSALRQGEWPVITYVNADATENS